MGIGVMKILQQMQVVTMKGLTVYWLGNLIGMKYGELPGFITATQ